MDTENLVGWEIDHIHCDKHNIEEGVLQYLQSNPHPHYDLMCSLIVGDALEKWGVWLKADIMFIWKKKAE